MSIISHFENQQVQSSTMQPGHDHSYSSKAIENLEQEIFVLKHKLNRLKKRYHSKRNILLEDIRPRRRQYSKISKISKLDEFVSHPSNTFVTPSKKDNNVGTDYIHTDIQPNCHLKREYAQNTSETEPDDASNTNRLDYINGRTCRSLLQISKEVTYNINSPNCLYAFANCRSSIGKRGRNNQTVVAFHTDKGFMNGIEIVWGISMPRVAKSNIHFQVFTGNGYICDINNKELKMYTQFQTFLVPAGTGFVLKNTASTRSVLGFTIDSSTKL